MEAKLLQQNDAAASRPSLTAANAARGSETPGCPLCGERKNQHVLFERGYDLRSCQVCELFFIHPYPQVSDQHGHVSSYEYKEIEVLDVTKSYSAAKRGDPFLEELLRDCAEASSVLDVGCGTGFLLECLAAYPHLRRVGVELNHERAEFARKVGGCEILEIPMEDFGTREKFDAITLINVFSHIPSFDALFNGIRGLLTQNGKLFIRTGEMRRGVNKWAQLSWGIPDDIYFLGMKTLDYICQRYKFRIDKHVMLPFVEAAFQPDRWQVKGRSPARNFLKQAVAQTPLALPLLKQSYRLIAGENSYLSYIVLTLSS